MTEHRIIERAEWGAKYRGGWPDYNTGKPFRRLPATEVWAHYPGAKTPPPEDATQAEEELYLLYLEEIGYQRFGPHTGTGWGEDEEGPYGAGISYSLLFAKSGRIYRGHEPGRVSSHTAGHNGPGMGYCFLVADGDGLTQAQIDAAAWALDEQVRRGELSRDVVDGGHREVFPTLCPTDAVMARLADINAFSGGSTMTRPTRATMQAVEAKLRERGFAIYCGPSDWAAGRCAPGKHAHASDSRHFLGLAVDFGYGAAAINDLEALLVELVMDTYLARWFPGIDFRKLWNVGPGNHEDHGHIDDNSTAWVSVVRPRAGVRARDGVDLFVPLSMLPEHVPTINDGLRLDKVAAAQTLLKQGGWYAGKVDGYNGVGSKAATTKAQSVMKTEGFYTGAVDGIPGAGTLAALKAYLAAQADPYRDFTQAHIKLVQTMLAKLGYYTDTIDGLPGPNFQTALEKFQSEHDLEPDALPGPATTQALEAAYEEALKPPPPPPPPPAPAVPAGTRIAGDSRWSTWAAVQRAALPAGRGVILASEGSLDLQAAIAASKNRADVTVLPVGPTSVNRAILTLLGEIDPAWVRVIGGPAAVPDTVVLSALSVLK